MRDAVAATQDAAHETVVMESNRRIIE